MSATPVKWVLVDESNGAKCANGESLTPLALARIAEAMALVLNGEFADEYGGAATVRVGSATDIQPDERVFAFLPTLPVQGASAYHDVNGNGVPVAYCAVTTCGSLFGPGDGIGVDATHEGDETGGDEGCNKKADDGKGQDHACESCDAVETQSYPKTLADGTVVYVSNFVLRSFFIPGAPPPYDYMSKAGLPGAVAPPGPMQTATGDGGNYQIVAPSNSAQESQVFAKEAPTNPGAKGMRIIGTPRSPRSPTGQAAPTSAVFVSRNLSERALKPRGCTCGAASRESRNASHYSTHAAKGTFYTAPPQSTVT
jgi:hypothetical protein